MVAVNAATNKIYVSNTFSNVITVIDGMTHFTTAVKAGSADAIAVDAHRDRIYLAGYEDKDLLVLDGKPSVVSRVAVGMHPWAMTVDESTGTLYVTRSGNAELAIVDEDSGSVTMAPTGAIPCAVAVNSVTHTVYVANHGGNTVTVIDGIKHAVVATVKVETGRKPSQWTPKETKSTLPTRTAITLR